MTKQELYAALVRLCQSYGFVTPATYDLLEAAVNSIIEDEENDHE